MKRFLSMNTFLYKQQYFYFALLQNVFHLELFLLKEREKNDGHKPSTELFQRLQPNSIHCFHFMGLLVLQQWMGGLPFSKGI